MSTKAAFLSATDEPIVRDIPDPEPAPGLVTIRVTHAAIHHGNLLGTGERPFGSEAVGVVETAPAASALTPGQRVGMFPAWGAVRERIALEPNRVFPVAADLDDEIAAQLYVNPLTAQMILRTAERVMAESGGRGPLIVSAAASSVGRIIVADALDRGLEVLAVTRSAGSAKRVAQDHGIPTVATAAEGWDAALRDALQGREAAVVADAHGGADGYALRTFLRRRGAILQWGDLSGRPVTAAAFEFLPSELRIQGVSVIWWLQEPEAARAGDLARIEELARARPELFRIADRFPLDRLAAALDRVKQASGDGTVLVEIR